MRLLVLILLELERDGANQRLINVSELIEKFIFIW